MNYYELENLPDDPYRVAPPYCAPGEVDPGDAPQVSDTEAVRRVIGVLMNDNGIAFGLTCEDWEELLEDHIIGVRRAVFAALLDRKISGSLTKKAAFTLDVLGLSMRVFIGNKANELLAEMDADALEREEIKS